jgi:DNA-binding GntR family transcriptional regulator
VSGFEDIRLNRTSTADQVAHGLADKIMHGELKAGEPLREAAIASALAISRNTVREAVRLLEKSGLVSYEFNRGTVVKEPSSADVSELYRARLALEVAAVSSASLSTTGIARVRDAYDQLAKLTESPDPRDLVSRDLGFHAAIVSLLESARIDAFYAGLVQELEFYLMVLSLEEREYEKPGLVVDEHRAIMAALETRDSASAGRLIADHVRSNAERVARVLESRTEGVVRAIPLA